MSEVWCLAVRWIVDLAFALFLQNNCQSGLHFLDRSKKQPSLFGLEDCFAVIRHFVENGWSFISYSALVCP